MRALHFNPGSANVPAKISAALDFLHYCKEVMAGGGGEFESKTEGRELKSNEQRCYDAAISSLTEYFNSDGFGAPPPPPIPPTDDGESPKQPVPSNA